MWSVVINIEGGTKNTLATKQSSNFGPTPQFEGLELNVYWEEQEAV